MIELYNSDNTTYARHGDTILAPSSCEITAELNGPWGLSLFHPIDQEGRWRAIVPGAVIRAASFNGSQLFRIRETGKTDAGVTAEADPIFMDARGDCFILSTHPTNATGQAALTALCANNVKYSGISDITAEATAYFERRNLIDAIAGASPSFLERWGGEILFDNFTIRINERVGADYGVRVLYGRNIAGINETINTDDVITRIVPVAYNGYTLAGSSPWVDSPNINSYPTIKTAEIKYDHIKLAQDVTGEPNEGDSVYNTLAEVRAALTAAAEADFAAEVDAPAVSLSIDMILLQNTEQYKNFVDLETVSLGDTVHCQHSRLGITSDARVVALKYDSLREAVTAVTLSSTEKTIFKQFATAAQAVRKALREDGSVVAEQIAGFIDGAMTQLRIQNTVAQHQDVRAILFEDLDSTSPTFGALSIGTQGLEISKQRTADGRDWVWTTAVTAEGIIADTIVTGLLSDQAGKNYWNLNNGDFSLSAGTTVGGSTVQNIANTAANGALNSAKSYADTVSASAASAAVAGQTQADIFNKLTNNGAAQGIFLTNGQLYVNGQYVQGVAAMFGQLDVAHHFLVDSSGKVHVTEVADDYTSGNNVLVDSTGMAFRDGTTQLAKFGSSLQIGKTANSHVIVNDTETSFYAGGANSLAGRISYGTAQTASGDMAVDWRGAISAGNGFTVPLEFYPTGYPLYVRLDATQAGGGTPSASITLTDTTAKTSGIFTAQYRSTTNSVRITVSEAVTSCDCRVEGDYKDFDQRFIFGNGIASARQTFVEGRGNQATAETAHAGGIQSIASGPSAWAFGRRTHASGIGAVAMNGDGAASGDYSAVFGVGGRATARAQMAVGKYNAADSSALFIVGNGADDSSRSNAFKVQADGSGSLAGDFTAGRLIADYVAIPANANLDDIAYSQQGHYRCTAANATTLTNSPTSTYFRMFVLSAQNTDPTSSNSPTVFRLLIDGNGKSWTQRIAWSNGTISSKTAWIATVTENGSGNTSISNNLTVGNDLAVSGKGTIAGDLTAGRLLQGWTAIANGANLNTTSYYKNGVYICASDADAASLNNCPTNVYFMMFVQNYYNAEPSDSSVTVTRTIIDGNRRVYMQRRSKSGGSWSGTSWTMPENLLINTVGETISPTTVSFTPSAGSSYSTFGGCYYYKIGKRVHVHLGLQNLTANTTTQVATLPAGYRPGTTHTASGWAGRTSSATHNVAGYVNSSGVVTLSTEGTTAMIDFDFYAAG